MIDDNVKNLIFITLTGKDRSAIDLVEAAELVKLYEQLPYASMRAAEALRAGRTALKGDALQSFWVEEAAVAEIIQRIKKNPGT